MRILIDQYKKECLKEYGKTSFETALVDKKIQSDQKYRPQFLTNNKATNTKVLSYLEQELSSCDEFLISVAFITMSGIAPLLGTLKELEEDGKRGRILTTDYLNFSEPKALKKLHDFKNIEIRMFKTNGHDGFHTKGYIFKKGEIYTIIVGSSNFTLNALTKNKEWNTKLVSSEDGEYTENILNDFEDMWNSTYTKNYDEFYEEYNEKYKLIQQRNKETEKLINNKFISIEQLVPNNMQVEFVKNCNKMLDEKKKRALLISATGTGKTYASAFLMKENNPGRVLFLAHRETILRQAKQSFKKVIGNSKKFAILSGNPDQDYEKADYLFSTMNMMSKDEVLEKYASNYFDMIVVDEVHRAGSESYKKIMAHFNPDFYLGMTASPETLNGFNVYDLFDNNIAYEIRLQKAMEEDMLCPFHYYGISDFEVDGEIFDDENVKSFSRLVDDNRVEHIISQIKFYGFSGNKPKGLVFCSSVDEAKALSDKFNERGYRTIALSGEDSSDARQDAIDRLVLDECADCIDYIFTRDIFNEGVDIPEINQVIMLRPTASPVVFVQQLGRGLRKSDNKEYVVIIDFIGNYMNNYMIPMALSGDRTYNKDKMRKYLIDKKLLVGSSTVHFDRITKSRIYSSIDRMNAKKKTLVDNYTNLKNKIGRIPLLFDFYEHGEIDPLLIIDYSKSYHDFMCSISKVEKDYINKFDKYEEDVLRFLSLNVANGKRVFELILLEEIITNGVCLNKTLYDKSVVYGRIPSKKDIVSTYRYLNGDFCNGNDDILYSNLKIIEKEDDAYLISQKLKDCLKNESFKNQLLDIVKLGLSIYQDKYKEGIDELGMCLYEKYSRKDVCRILNWDKDESSVLYGYRIKHNTCPLFVTYNKDESIEPSIHYGDEFDKNNTKIFYWFTRNNVALDSKEVRDIVESKKTGLCLPLFIKKDDDEGADFYYMGRVFPINQIETTILINKKDKKTNTITQRYVPIVKFTFEMEHEVREDMYEYITTKENE